LATVLGRTVPSWTAEDVHQAALKGDPLADAFYALRARTVMSALGDQTLAVKATGGAFVAGGIGARLADWLRRPDALARFHVGGPQSELMARIPVSLIRDETAPLIGAALLWRDWRARGWR
jgi:glucokinase